MISCLIGQCLTIKKYTPFVMVDAEQCKDSQCQCIEFNKYLNFKPNDDRFFFSELVDEYPEACRELWSFFLGNRERREKHDELYDFYTDLYDFINYEED